MRILSLLPAALVLSLMIAAAQTSHNYPTPSEPMDPQSHKTEQPQTATRRNREAVEALTNRTQPLQQKFPNKNGHRH
jgi:hypothetical protein